jgi:hypothetical protein
MMDAKEIEAFSAYKETRQEFAKARFIVWDLKDQLRIAERRMDEAETAWLDARSSLNKLLEPHPSDVGVSLKESTW